MIALQKVSETKRRRGVVADLKMQRALAMRMVVHCLVFMVVGGVLASMNEYMANAATNPQVLRESLARNFFSYGCTVVVLLPVLIYDSMKLSNRVVGPICRLRNTIREISRNEPVPPLGFRANDYWQELPREFNVMMERLRGKDMESEKDLADVSELGAPEVLSAR